MAELGRTKEKEMTTPFGVNLMRSRVSYRGAHGDIQQKQYQDGLAALTRFHGI